jgi:hypothetical protein
VNSQRSKKGITHTWRLTLSDGTVTHDASFQSIYSLWKSKGVDVTIFGVPIAPSSLAIPQSTDRYYLVRSTDPVGRSSLGALKKK